MKAKRRPAETVKEPSAFEDWGTARVDAKHRILLKGAVEEHYRVYRNAEGQILLDPQVMIPAREAWLYKNKAALGSVRRGLRQAAEGKLVDLGRFDRHAEDELDD